MVASLGLALLAASAGHGGVAAAAPSPIQVQFLFDLGDGTYDWVSATIPGPGATNATWDAMQSAAARAALWISWSWYSGSFGSGIFITDLGNRSPPTVALFVWDAANGTWDPAPVGITDLVLSAGAAVALADTDYNPATYAPYPPAPTPDHPFPAEEFRGDLANSGSTPSSAPDGVQVLWDRPLVGREIESSPVVVGARVYVLTMDGMFALDEATGSLLWSNPRIAGLSTPAFYNGTLLVAGSDGRMHCLDASGGSELWNVTLLARTLFSGITSSPKLLFDTAFVGTFNESGGSGQVVALGAVNGTILWRHTAPGSVSFSSPAVANGTVYVGIIGRYNTTTQITYDPPYGVLALDAATGGQRWFVPLNASVAASPMVVRSSVFVPAKNGYLYALDAGTGALEWKAAIQAGVSSPAYHAGTLYVAGGSSSFGGLGRVTALDASTGGLEWTFHPNGVVQSSVTYADGLILFSSNAANGTLYALDATGGSLVWSYTPSPAAYIFGSPAVADGMVFAPSDNGHMYAFENPSALLNLTAEPPASAPLNGNVTLNITIRAVAGAARNVTLGFALTDLQVLAASPMYDRTSNATGSETLFWDFGTMGFGETREIDLHVRGTCHSFYQTPCPGGAFQQWLTLLNANHAGVAQNPVELRFNVLVSGTSPGPADLTLPILLGVAAAAVVVLVLFIVLRRRRDGP